MPCRRPGCFRECAGLFVFVPAVLFFTMTGDDATVAWHDIARTRMIIEEMRRGQVTASPSLDCSANQRAENAIRILHIQLAYGLWYPKYTMLKPGGTVVVPPDRRTVLLYNPGIYERIIRSNKCLLGRKICKCQIQRYSEFYRRSR